MDARLQRRVQRYGWDKASDDYERFWGDQIAPSQSMLLGAAKLSPGERVLDVACGTGLVTFPAARAVGPEGAVTATDISERMVVAGRARAAAAGVGNARFERMDAEDLRYPDGSFDAVLCALGLMYFPDPERALAEMARVLRPGGRVVAAVWGERKKCGWAEIFPIVDRRVRSEVCPLFFRLGTGDELRRAFEGAGLAAVETTRLRESLRYGSAEEALGAAFAGGPVALAHSRFDDAARNEAYAEYLDSIRTHRKGSGYEIPGEFVVARGERVAATVAAGREEGNR